MMDEKQKNAIRKWYSQNWILEAVKRTLDAEEWEELESLVHRTVLLPLSKHRELPDFMRNETRFRMVEKVDPKRFAELAKKAQESAKHRWSLMQQMAKISFPGEEAADGNGGGSNGREQG